MVLTAINQYQLGAYAGMLEGLDDSHDVESWINNAGTTAGVGDLVINPLNATTYSGQIYGIPYSFLSVDNVVAHIRDGIIATIAAIPALAALVTAAASANNVRVTERFPENGPAGITALDVNTTLSVVTAHSQTEPMPAGIGVYSGSGFQDLRLPRTNATSLFRGITLHQHSPVNEKLFPAPSALLYPANSVVPVVKRGKVWVPVEQTVALTDTPFMRFAASANGTQLGAIRKDNDGGTAVTLAGICNFRQIGAAGSVALLGVAVVP